MVKSDISLTDGCPLPFHEKCLDPRVLKTDNLTVYHTYSKRYNENQMARDNGTCARDGRPGGKDFA